MRLDFQSVTASHVAARPGAKPALKNLTLCITAGEQVAVIGPSGAGKTTLLHIAGAALVPQSGEVRLNGISPWGISVKALKILRSKLFIAPQTPPLPPRQRVITAVLAARLPALSLWASLRSLFYPSDIAGAHTALARFDLADKLFERVDRLSGGERQRIGLARALLAPATLWLIDEPLSALDPTRAQQALSTLIDEARARKVTLLATLHQVDAALQNFSRIVGLRDGELAFDLPASEVTPELLRELYAQELLAGNSSEDKNLSIQSAPLPVVMHCR
jgi:phosphonate transport system ATP-binding protein